jgi:biotin synthase
LKKVKPSTLNKKQNIFLRLAEDIIEGDSPDVKMYEAIARLPVAHTFSLLPGANMLREHYFGKTVHLCTICNGKSGRCSEDCKFCAQSSHYNTDASVYPLMGKEKLVEAGKQVAQTSADRFSIVTTGRHLGDREVKKVADALKEVKNFGINTCASLGILEADAFVTLKAAGIDRYHHNLETAQSFFSNACTTHQYQDRVDTIKRAKAHGFSVCAGGIFGVGETNDQVLELALALKALNVDAVPLNFLVPIPGTPLGSESQLSPLDCLKIIALFRYVIPDKEIIICGGREANLKALHPFVFYAGASGIMTGNYLTATGRSVESDLELISQLGLSVRKG